jgi:hypothetical protein
MYQESGLVIPIPRSRFDYVYFTIGLVESDTTEMQTLENLGKIVAAGISLYNAYSRSQPIAANLFDSLATAVAKFIDAFLKLFDEDTKLLGPISIKVTKEQIEAAPELKVTDTAPLVSRVPWVREPRHDRLTDVESIRRGPVLHGYRNDVTDEEDDAATYLEPEFVTELAGDNPEDGVFNEEGSWWYEVRFRYELTRA